MAANAPREVGKSQAATSLGSIQTQGVSELAHLPPSRTGDPRLVCFSLVRIVLYLPLKAAPVPCEGNRQRERHRVRAGHLGALSLWSQCGLRARISWRADLPETNCTWQVLGHGYQPSRDRALLAPASTVGSSPGPAALRRTLCPQLARQEEERKDKTPNSQGTGDFP